MLVVISDLHFTDGATRKIGDVEIPFNVSPKAFKLFFGWIAEVARRKPVTGVTVVYNGDIFDLLRTEAWFDVAPEYRPWAVPEDEQGLECACTKILNNTIAKNQEALDWLSGAHAGFKLAWGNAPALHRVYVPGNHDRLVNRFPGCRAAVRTALLGKSGNEVFVTPYPDAGHRTLVMHGHEADTYNCERLADGAPDYAQCSIGEPMTTMLFTRLVYEVQQEAIAIPDEARARFRDIDNVRPALAALRYIQDIVQDFGIGAQLTDVFQTIVREFKQLPFYADWIQRHDRWTSARDEADKLQWALGAIQVLGSHVPAGLIERAAPLLSREQPEELARKCLDAAPELLYCIMGHTHEPAHVPLDTATNKQGERHYLNSGTFRKTLTQTLDKQAFSVFQRMSYVIIYGPKEFDPGMDYPAYELWSGERSMH